MRTGLSRGLHPPSSARPRRVRISRIAAVGLCMLMVRVCEITGSEKIGQVMPGTQIPVVDEQGKLVDLLSAYP